MKLQADKMVLTEAEAAEAIGVSERTLWQMRRNDQVPHIRFGRRVVYSVASLTRWLEQQADAKQHILLSSEEDADGQHDD